MEVHIAPKRTAYRGMNRELDIEDILPKKTRRKEANAILDPYFQYLTDVWLSAQNEASFQRICNYYLSLTQRGISCELIAVDTKPLSEVYGHSLHFLGIDILYDRAESPLASCWERVPQVLLNENCLCKIEKDVPAVIEACNYQGIAWTPCWVYRVLL